MGAAGFENPQNSRETPANGGETTPKLEPETPTGDGSRGADASIAKAIEMAARAGKWELVETLTRLLDGQRK